MLAVAQCVDYGHARVAGDAGDGVMREGPQHDHIDPAFEIAGNVREGFARAQQRAGLVDKNCLPAQRVHRHLEGQPRAQRSLLKEKYHLLVRQSVAIHLRLLLDMCGEGQNALHLRGAKLCHLAQVFAQQRLGDVCRSL